MKRDIECLFLENAHSYNFNLEFPIIDLINITIHSVRYLRDEFWKYPQLVVDNLFDSTQKDNKAYVSLDIIELRRFLTNECFKTINSALSFIFAKKYFLDYPIWIGVTFKKSEQIGNFIYDMKEVEISDIFINNNAVNQKKANDITEIVKEANSEYSPLVKVYAEVSVLNIPKLASSLEKYIVNIENIGIKDQVILANNEESAVEQAVNEKWSRIKSRFNLGDNFKPSKYSPRTWLKFKYNPIWNTIVSKKN